MRQLTKSLLAISGLLLCSDSCNNDEVTGSSVEGRSPILFTSGREGNFDIYIMESDGSAPRRLTRDTAVDQSADWSPDGFEIAFMSRRDGDYEVYVMLVNGRGLRQLTSNGTADGFPRWSPDGSQILFTSARDGNLELYVMSPDGTNPTRLTSSSGDDIGGAWSPDGARIAFVSERGGGREIYLMRPDGTDLVRLTNNTAFEGSRLAWSPDGARIAFHAYGAETDESADIYVIDVDGANETQLTRDPANDRFPVWSPDGRQVGFTSDREGDDEIYLMNADGTGLVRLTNSTALDVLDAWRSQAQPTLLDVRRIGSLDSDLSARVAAAGPVRSPARTSPRHRAGYR
jgi:Tol biopolymer transport system component